MSRLLAAHSKNNHNNYNDAVVITPAQNTDGILIYDDAVEQYNQPVYHRHEPPQNYNNQFSPNRPYYPENNSQAHANAQATGSNSAKSQAQASSNNGGTSSNAQASSQTQGNNGYCPPCCCPQGASSASSAASATSGIVNGVPVAASSASAAAAGAGNGRGGSSSSASASSSGISGGYEGPWGYRSRNGGEDKKIKRFNYNGNGDGIIF